jgi:hypothetical protein
VSQDEAVVLGSGHTVGVNRPPDGAAAPPRSDSDARAAALARRQASRIAELEHELARVKLAAESARARVLEEASRRARTDAERRRIEQELESIYATRLWRYSASMRRWYARARRLVGGSPRRDVPTPPDEFE